MNLRQLEHVLALADHRNFHRAADAVGVTQPALTQSIRNLEEECGVALFERSRRDVSPTAFGMAVIQTARQTLGQVSNLRRELELMKNLQSGRLIVGCDAWVAEAMVAPTLARMLERYPDLRFSVRVGLVDAMMDEVVAGSIDLYLGAPPEARDARLHWHDIVLPPMVLVCKPGHPLLDLANPTPSDCLAYPIAAPILPQWYFDWLGQQVGDPTTPEGRDIYSYFLESDDTGVIRHIVRTTETISSMLPSMVTDDLARGVLSTIALKEMDFTVPAVICHTAGRPLAPAGEILLAELVAQAATLREGRVPVS
jgi:DNA-binding transcriptional LysR family regulator